MKITTFRSNIEARSFTENGDMILEGYAIVANSPGPFKIFGEEYVEIITPSAIESADISNVVLNREHDDKYVVARTTNGTLQLTKDEKGLFVRAKLSQNQVSKDLYEDVKSGLLNKMSFRAEFEAEEFVDATDKIPEFRITKLGKVYDVSVVAFPWYEDTEISARSKFMKKEEIMEKEINTVEEKQDVVVEKQEIDYDTLATKVAEKMKQTEQTKEEQPAQEVVKEIEGGAEEVQVLSTKTNEVTATVEERNKLKSEYEVANFMANIVGSTQARAKVSELKERATAYGLTNLFENHTPETAANTIPDVMQSKVIEYMRDKSDILKEVSISYIKGNPVFRLRDGVVTASFKKDGEAFDVSNTTTFKTKTIKGNKVGSLTFISDELLSASMEDLMTMIVRDIAEAIITKISETIFTGNGTDEPEGVMAFATDVTTDLATQTTLIAKLRKAKSLFPQQMRGSLTIYMNEDDYFDKYLSLTDTTGQPLQGITDESFKGTPVKTDVNIQAGTILIADFSEYQINFTEQINTKYSDDFKFDQSARTIKGQAVVGGAPLNTQAFKKFNTV